MVMALGRTESPSLISRYSGEISMNRTDRPEKNTLGNKKYSLAKNCSPDRSPLPFCHNVISSREILQRTQYANKACAYRPHET